ncbi:MAG: GntR family transcriptional regulator [Bacteroidales bacterium]|nr:GntR family transcriptional regulator [Bacteroidales bacterium]MBQ9313241.1 GntR family transcriptional regulator [Bacteroidales bacterium]
MLRDNTPIFIQLADTIADDIISEKFSEQERIPSVREIAAQYEVNVNTAMKAIERLSNNNIIYNKRGMGYFVNKGAKDEIMKTRRQDFFDNFLPLLYKNMKQLGISFEEIKQEF